MGKQVLVTYADALRVASIARNVESIMGIPEQELQDRDARVALVTLAQAGVNVYAYWSGSGHATIWLQPYGAQTDGSLSCAEWQRIYQQEASEEVLCDLVSELYDAHKTYVAAALAYLAAPHDMGLRRRVDVADQTLRDRELRVRLTQYRLAARGYAA